MPPLCSRPHFITGAVQCPSHVLRLNWFPFWPLCTRWPRLDVARVRESAGGSLECGGARGPGAGWGPGPPALLVAADHGAPPTADHAAPPTAGAASCTCASRPSPRGVLGPQHAAGSPPRASPSVFLSSSCLRALVAQLGVLVSFSSRLRVRCDDLFPTVSARALVKDFGFTQVTRPQSPSGKQAFPEGIQAIVSDHGRASDRDPVDTDGAAPGPRPPRALSVRISARCAPSCLGAMVAACCPDLAPARPLTWVARADALGLSRAQSALQ